MQEVIQIIISSVALSVVHAAIPNHWLPLIMIAKTEKWSERELLGITAITGFAHTLSTVIIGIVVGLIGFKLSSSFESISKIIAPSVLIVLGLYYIISDALHARSGDHHHHHHGHEHISIKPGSGKSKKAIISSLCLGMFFSPCLEIEAYYFKASSKGWIGISIVSIIYLVITVIGMMILVKLGSRGIEKLKFHFLEHYEKLIIGVLLTFIGVVSLFIEY